MGIPERMNDVSAQPLIDWAIAGLAEQGITADGAPEVRNRDWSIVVRQPTDRGVVWLKASARGFAAEAGLLVLLGAAAPEHVLQPLLADPDRGWFVTPDGGPVLSDSGAAGSGQWISLLTGYADLQRAVADEVDALRATGLPDMSPATLPAWWEKVLDRAAEEPDVPLGLADLDALRGLGGQVAAWAAELDEDITSGRLPLSVDHNDLHTDNVFVTGGELRIFDWGDAALAHPFTCLGLALRTATGIEDVPTGIDDGPLRAAYLQRWAGPDAEVPTWMQRSCLLAEGMSYLSLAASWLRLPGGFGPEFAGYFASFLTGFRDFAADPQLPTTG
ncbi:phosphotransferase [Nakamurella sp. YIM 132087]|uniref:Phosphotransferase n=1 Tax=Nakamurella alba TaxID=2665158 RepID=A0A7K1FHL5_9ACTN|nr:phosphotransferase [Nakamurella alba]MTD12939.1 phosphotransferase [Nakamurella alba]